MSHFSRIQLEDWRQIGNIDVDLSGRATILTGQNGTGKSTLLNILGRHFGWNVEFVSTPYLSKRTQKQVWSDASEARLRERDIASEPHTPIGRIVYTDGKVCELSSPNQVQAQYHVNMHNFQAVRGLHIPSHRAPATYNKVSEIPTEPTKAEQHYQEYLNILTQTYRSPKSTNPGIAQKKSLISMALFGYGNTVVLPNNEYRSLFEGFQTVLQFVLPEDIGFQRLEIRMPEVVLVTRTGSFSLDAMSGGISALFGLAWQIHMYTQSGGACTVTIDEPENHLHPSMQRGLLPSLMRAFPEHRFIVATHSPFVVSSTENSLVYALVFDDRGRVESHRLDSKDFSGTPNQVLQHVLDVPSLLPLWVEHRINAVIANAGDAKPVELATRLMHEVRKLGIADNIPPLSWERLDAQATKE